MSEKKTFQTLVMFFSCGVFGAILIFAFFFMPDKKENSDLIFEDKKTTETKTDSSVDQSKNVKDFIQERIFIFNDKEYNDLTIKKYNKKYNYKELDDSKKFVLKLMVLSKAKKTTDKFIEKTMIAKDDRKLLDDFLKNIDDSIVKTKENLYKLYGSSIHPLDKEFLESLK